MRKSFKVEGSPFRGPTNKRYTRVLFYEQWIQLVEEDRADREPLFSLHQDRPGLVNLRKVYVELGDPTGYALATRYLENYDHWLLLMKCSWFKAAKEAWDVELDAKLKSEGMSAIRAISDGIEGVQASVQLSAAKYLANLEHRKERGAAAKRGRPSAAEVEGELKRTARETSDIENDLARIRAVS